MKRLFLLLALVGMIATSCEDSGIEEPSNPTEQPDDNTDEEQPGGDDNTDEEQPGDDENEDNDESPVFEIDGPGKYTIGAEGGSIEVVVTTNLEYRLEVSEDAQSWLTIADTRAVRTERLTISVSPNNTDSERTATISVFDGADNKVFSFTLTQEYANDDNTDEEQPGDDENEDDGELPVFEIDGPGEYTIGAEGGSIDVVVTTNLEYRLEVSEDAQSWLTIADTRAVRTERLTISVSPNNTDSERTATISVFDGADNKVFSFTLTQECVNPDEIIKFVDNTIKTICLAIWDTNGDAELSIGEAVAVTDIGTIFQSKDIIAFDEFKYFTSVTTIVTGAFKDCANLVKISIPDSVTTIGEKAFYNCDSLTSVTIGDGVTTIGGYAFSGCDSLTSVTIPDSVTTIGWRAFEGCDSLTSVTIGDSVTTIGDEAFSGCDSLTSVYISDIAAWCNIPFSDLHSNPLSNGCNLYLNNELATDLTIPDSVTAIGNWAFYGCVSLTSVNIPDSVTTIGEKAFYNCDSLTSVTIGDSVTTIGDSAFYECSSLTSITIPDSVTTIGENAFYSCNSLTSVTIGDSVTTIGDSAFEGCRSLTSLTIGDSVTTIGDYAFYECDSLTSITIPDSVTEIGDSAFSGCTGKLIINSKIVETDYDYYNFPSTHGWLKGYYFLSLTIGNGVTLIGRYAFKNCSTLTSVTIGDGVTTIGNGAFYGCDMLTSITIPNSVTTIGGSAFGYCIRLRSVTIPDSVTTIGDSAFYECDSLTSITIPDSITTIGEYAFKNCDRLTSVTIPDSVTTIGEKAFYECYSLTSVTIPESVTTIGLAAFEYCRSLTSVFCKATTPPALGGYAVFDYNPSGRKIYVPTESVDAYKSASRWSSYASAIVGYDFENGVVVE